MSNILEDNERCLVSKSKILFNVITLFKLNMLNCARSTFHGLSSASTEGHVIFRWNLYQLILCAVLKHTRLLILRLDIRLFTFWEQRDELSAREHGTFTFVVKLSDMQMVSSLWLMRSVRSQDPLKPLKSKPSGAGKRITVVAKVRTCRNVSAAE